MSLISEAYDTEFVLMDSKRVPDGDDGFTTEWSDGPTIKAAVSKDSSMLARIGEAQGVKSVYTIITPRAIILRFPDVLRRVSDGQYFRVTSKGEDSATPKTSSLDMRKVTAEEWELPSEN